MTKKLTNLTPEDRETLLSKSPFALPDNPSSKQFSASQIKRKMYEPSLLLFDWLQKSIDEGNSKIEATDEELDKIKKELENVHVFEDVILFNNGTYDFGFSSFDEIRETDVIIWKNPKKIDFDDGELEIEKGTFLFRKQCQKESDKHFVFTCLLTGFYTHTPFKTDKTILSLTFGKEIDNKPYGVASVIRSEAKGVLYSNSTSKLKSETVQGAIDELASKSGSFVTGDYVEKITEADTYTRAYTTDGKGGQTSVIVAYGSLNNSIVRRDDRGGITAKNVVSDYFSDGTKKIKISEIADLQEKITDLKNALYGSILSVEPQTYENVGVAVMDRANGYPVVDNQKAQVVSIKGKTEVKPVMGSVDLGSLNWQYAGGNIFYATLLDASPCDDYTKANISCTKYETKRRADLADGVISLSQTDIIVQDNSYANATTFKQSLSGIILTYATTENEIVNTNVRKITSHPFNIFDEEWELGGLASTGNPYNDISRVRSKNFIKVVGGQTYTLREETQEGWTNRYVNQYDKDFNHLGVIGFGNYTTKQYSAKLKDECCYIKLQYYNNKETQLLVSQVSKVCFHLTNDSSMNGTYKPYKEPQTIVVNSGELNGIGSAQDERTETRTTRRTAVYTITGYETFTIYETITSGLIRYSLSMPLMKKGSALNGVCDRLPTDNSDYNQATTPCIRFGQNNTAIYFYLDKTFTTSAEVGAYLKGTTIVYPLETPTVEENGFGEVLFNVQRGGTIETDSNGDVTLTHVVYKPIQ